MESAMAIVLSRVRPHVRLGKLEFPATGIDILAVRFQNVDEEQVVEEHPAGVDDALSDGPVIVSLFFRFLKQQFRKIDGAPAAADMDGLAVPIIPEVQEGVIADESEADGAVDEGFPQLLRKLLEDAPEKEDEGIPGMNLGQANVIGEKGQSGLLPKENGLVRAANRPIDLAVADIAIKDAEVDVG